MTAIVKMTTIYRNMRVILITALLTFGFFVLFQNVMRLNFLASEHRKLRLKAAQVSSKHENKNGLLLRDEDTLYEERKESPELADSRELKEFMQEPMLAERLKVLLNCKDHYLQMETLQYGNYWLVQNFIRGNISQRVSCAETITYTTHGDFTFFDNLATLVKRWQAPISFALYAPGYDFTATMDSIQYVRNCLPESELIRQYVTFHIYFPAQHMPEYIPLNEEAALMWRFDCFMSQEPYKHVAQASTYRHAKNLTYPINVGRNIARRTANTYFIFACDIELFPSPGLAQQFLEMVDRNHSVLSSNDNLRVFPIPVFELEANASIPENKAQLREMLHTKMAIPFHSRICKNCHLVPEQEQWVNQSDSGQLTLFSMGKRQLKFKYWEPFYISDNREPFFDERVTWEGQSNKRIQGYAMCLLNYEYHVLHPGFLVHSPGIKNYNKHTTRLNYVKAMNLLIKNTIKPEYLVLYGNNSKCAV